MKKVLKLVVNLLSAFFIVSFLSAGTCSVDATATNQFIRCIGASSAWTYMLNLSNWANQLFADNDLEGYIGLSSLRARIDPNGSHASEVNNLVLAKNVNPNILLWSTEWSPPPQYKANNNVNGGTDNNKFLGAESGNPNSADTGYANYLVQYLQYCQSRGINLYAISPQNEPDWNPDYESCLWTAGQFEVFIRAFRTALNNAGFTSVKILFPDTVNHYGFSNLAKTTMNNATTSQYVGILATHLYGAMPSPLSSYGFSYVTNQEWWETEISGGSDLSTIQSGIELAEWIQNCFVNAGMNGFHYWWLNDLVPNNVPSKRFYALGNYSKFIRPGYYRMNATAQPSSNVYVSAYKNTNNSSPTRIVIVAYNKNSSSVSQTFNLNGANVTSVTPWITDSSRNLSKQGAITVTNNSFTYTLPGLSIVSFVGNTSNISTPTATPTPKIFNIPGRVEAEDYRCCEGTGYHDTDTTNQGGAYRNDGVDIETCTDTGGGYNIGYAVSGEWLSYSLNVTQAGTYNIGIRVASNGSGGTFHLEIDGVNITGTLTVPNTGGWQTWQTITVNNVNITAGQKTLRLVMDGNGGTGYAGNFNYIDFTAVSNTPTPTRTNTPVPPTNTPTRTATPIPPTSTPTTPTVVPTTPIPTNTYTRTNTPVPPTNTPTRTATPIPPTSTPTTPTVVPTTPIPTNTYTRTNTPVPPTNTPTKTFTPVPPTPTPVVTAAGNITLRLKSGVTSDSTNSPHPQIRIVNTGTSAINLNTVEARYWINCDCTGQSVQAWLDWAGKLPQGTSINSNVQLTVVAKTQGAQTHYISVKFTGGIILQPNEYAEVQMRFNKSDWSNMLQSNDWSYAAYNDFTNWSRITGYINGVKVWGDEPTAGTTSQSAQVVDVLSYPNPATNGSGTTITYSIGSSGVTAGDVNYSISDADAEVMLKIYTISGRMIWSKELRGISNVSTGKHAIYWDGKTSGGREIAAGTYILKVELKSRGEVSSKSFVIVMLK